MQAKMVEYQAKMVKGAGQNGHGYFTQITRFEPKIWRQTIDPKAANDSWKSPQYCGH